MPDAMKIDLKDKLAHIHKEWTPHIIAELNGQQVKLAKLKGDFVWHDHANEDELFLVIEGQLFIDFRDQPTVELLPGQMYVVPKGVQHFPRTGPDGASVMLFEPATTQHTGEVETERTVKDLPRL